MSLPLFASFASPSSLIAGLVAGGAIGAGASRAVQRTATAKNESRPRGGRLPLPASVAELTEQDVPALESANAFLDRLGELPLSEWLDIGRAIETDRNALAQRSTAWVILDATIADRQLSVAAWYVRDAVETVAFLARNSGPKLSRTDRRAFAGAQGAAEEAALAVLARAHLSAQDFDALCAPFVASDVVRESPA